ncbi:unnamed protein product [Malus baccata var. baccata]
MGTIAGVIFLTTTPLIRPRGLVGRFPNLHCPSSKFSHCRTTANTATDAPPFQVSATASSPSSAIDEEKEVTSSGNVGADDLLIVGPGVLGRLVAQKWREEHPGCQIHGQTVTADHHEELSEEGINPCFKGTKTTHKFPYVIFCAPPSRTSDYSADVRMAALNWNGEGSFLFTSSSAPYDCNNNGSCDEDTPVVPIGRSPRTDVLLKAEEVIGGALYILYESRTLKDYLYYRGKHSGIWVILVFFIFEKGDHRSSPRSRPESYTLRGDGIILLYLFLSICITFPFIITFSVQFCYLKVTYIWLFRFSLNFKSRFRWLRFVMVSNILPVSLNCQDAASLSVAILKKRLRNQILLGCDNHPLSRQEVMDLVTKSKLPANITCRYLKGILVLQYFDIHLTPIDAVCAGTNDPLDDDGGLSLTALLLAIVVALVIMTIFSPPPRRGGVVALYRCY